MYVDAYLSSLFQLDLLSLVVALVGGDDSP